jgi:hypothetical protein
VAPSYQITRKCERGTASNRVFHSDISAYDAMDAKTFLHVSNGAARHCPAVAAHCVGRDVAGGRHRRVQPLVWHCVRSKGSIKKSRPVFADLIQAIAAAAAAQARPKHQHNERVNRAKIAANQCRRELEASLAREISLLHELYEVKKKLFRLTGEAVLPLRGKAAK